MGVQPEVLGRAPPTDRSGRRTILPVSPHDGPVEPVRIGLTTYREPASWGVWSEPADLLPADYARSVQAGPKLGELPAREMC